MDDNDFNPDQQTPDETPHEENMDSQQNEADRDSLAEDQAGESSADSTEEPPVSDSDAEELHSNSQQTDPSTEPPQTNPYGQPQQPGYPYQQQYNQWQQGNYYGQQPYNPYGQNNLNGYGQYNQYGQPQQPKTPNSTYQPYGQQFSPQPNGQPPKKKMNGGLKAFLWIIGVLAALFVVGFCSYGVYMTYHQSSLTKSQTGSSASSQQSPDSSEKSSSSDVQGAVSGNGTDPNSSGLVIEEQPTTNELSAKEVYKKVAASVVSVITSVQGASSSSDGTSQGSGIVATTDGYIITNAHVVNYSKTYQVKVILYNKKEYKGTVVGFDKTTDLAVIKIDAKDLSPAQFGNADNLSVGDWVMAIGNPAGVEFSSSLTRGIVSALNRTVATYSASGMTYIQTDAAINPGNSGGALVNMYGQVVGINSIKIAATGYEGMGFAIPISKAKTIIDALITKGYVSGRTRLGISAIAVTDEQVQEYGVPQGVAIAVIDSDSSLKNSGIVKGDIITKADDKAITTMEGLYAILNLHKPGDTMKLTVYRAAEGTTKSKTFDVKIKLLEDKGETQGTVSSSSSK